MLPTHGQDADEDGQLDAHPAGRGAAGPSRAATGSAARCRPPRPIRRSSAARVLRPGSTRLTRGSWPSAPSIQMVIDDRKVRHVVDLAQTPLAGDDRVGEPGDVEHRERDHFAPRQRVADAPIERVRPILGEPDDVRAAARRRAAARAGPRCRSRPARAPSHSAIRRSKPRSNRSNVSGPGAMKNTKIQIGQCASR